MGYLLHRLAGNDRGATAIEYGLILAFIAMAIIVGVSGVATATNGMWDYVTRSMHKNN